MRRRVNGHTAADLNDGVTTRLTSVDGQVLPSAAACCGTFRRPRQPRHCRPDHRGVGGKFLNIFAVALLILFSRVFALSLGLTSLSARPRQTIACVRASVMSTTSVPTGTGWALAEPDGAPKKGPISWL